MKALLILLLMLFINSSYPQGSMTPKYFNCSNNCEFVKLKNDGTHKFEAPGKLGGTKKMLERYDAKGNVIFVKAFNWHYTGNSENFIFKLSYDSLNRIIAIERKSVRGFLPFVYVKNWKVEINYDDQTVRTYSVKKSKYVQDGTKRLLRTPTIHQLFVWSFEDVKL